MSCSLGHRCGSYPMLLWLWHRLAAAASDQHLAWELPHGTGVALKRKKRKKGKKGKKGRKEGRKKGRKEKKRKGLSKSNSVN